MNEKLIPFLSLLLICGVTGCAGVKSSLRPSTKSSTWNPIEALTKDKEQKLEDAEPASITAIWKESVFEKPGVASVSGFGGRFFFYDDDSNPIKADGELVIYGFNDSKENDTKSGPDKKFVFPKSEFQSHFSDSGLGPSYSLWIPWQKVGGVRKMITLIPVFKRADGTIMKCAQSTVILPGKEPLKEEVAQAVKDQPYKFLGSSSAIAHDSSFHRKSTNLNKPSQVQQVGFDRADNSPARIKTSTINLPPSMAQRVAMAKPAEKELVKPQFNHDRGAESNDREASLIPTNSGGFLDDNSFPLNKLADQTESSESSELSSKSSPRKVFGAPGSFN